VDAAITAFSSEEDIAYMERGWLRVAEPPKA